MARGSFPLGNPFGGQGSQMGRGPAGGPGPADPMSTMDPNTINAALAPYGTQLPTSYQQPGPAENTGWGQRHPGVAGGIDNALIAVAGMGPTGDTAGENISNVARGIMGVQPYRRQFMSEQAMVPFQIAKEVGGLQAQQSYMQMQKSMAGYYADRGQAALQANAQRLESAQIRAQVEATKEPMVMNGPDGKQGVGFFKFDPQSGIGKYEVDPSIDVKSFMETKAKSKFSTRFGSSATSEYVGNALANHYKGWDKIPDVLDDTGLKVWQQAVRETSPAVYDASLNDTRNQNEFYAKNQLDLINRGMPKVEVTAEDQKSIEDQAKGMMGPDGKPLAYGARRAWVKDQLQATKDSRLKAHDSYMTAATQYMALHPADQQRMGGFQGYMQQQSATQPPPTGNPTPGATNRAAPDLNGTIQQMMGLLAK